MTDLNEFPFNLLYSNISPFPRQWSLCENHNGIYLVSGPQIGKGKDIITQFEWYSIKRKPRFISKYRNIVNKQR